jgi:hypothetical protein
VVYQPRAGEEWHYLRAAAAATLGRHVPPESLKPER